MPQHQPTLPAGLTVRPCTPADFGALAHLLNAVHPAQPTTVEALQKAEARRLVGQPFDRQWVERHGTPVGMFEVTVPVDEDHPDWLRITFATLEPDLAPTLLRLAETSALGLGASTLICKVLENRWEKGIYEAQGYQELERMWPATLDLTGVDFSRFIHLQQQARAAGVDLRPLSSFGTFDEDRQRKLHALWSAIEKDIPSTVPLSEWSFETWKQQVLPGLEQHLGGLWLAVAPDGTWVGLTGLYEPIPGHPGTLHNDLTGVLPDWRGHSIGLSLKLAAIRAALERGFTHARTSNHSLNLPMLNINEALGFVRETARITLIRQV